MLFKKLIRFFRLEDSAEITQVHRSKHYPHIDLESVYGLAINDLIDTLEDARAAWTHKDALLLISDCLARHNRNIFLPGPLDEVILALRKGADALDKSDNDISPSIK